jgi:hypothetical protein
LSKLPLATIKMQVISINDKTEAKKKADLLEILDDLRAEVEAGLIEEFVTASVDKEEINLLHAELTRMLSR